MLHFLEAGGNGAGNMLGGDSMMGTVIMLTIDCISYARYWIIRSFCGSAIVQSLQNPM